MYMDSKLIEQARNADMIAFLGKHCGFTFNTKRSAYRCKQHPSLAIMICSPWMKLRLWTVKSASSKSGAKGLSCHGSTTSKNTRTTASLPIQTRSTLST